MIYDFYNYHSPKKGNKNAYAYGSERDALSSTDKIIIDLWNNDKYEKRKYRANAQFYPHGNLFGYCYAGNIYDDSGAMIGDYSATDSGIIEDCFIIQWN